MFLFEKLAPLFFSPAKVTTGPSCSVSSRNVPNLTPNDLAILIKGASEGIILFSSI
jgi:hypothetical protein